MTPSVRLVPQACLSCASASTTRLPLRAADGVRLPMVFCSLRLSSLPTFHVPLRLTFFSLRLPAPAPISVPAPTPAPPGKGKSVELEDVKFHQCVRLARFENDRTISFIPPDGQFVVMTYRLNTHVCVLLLLQTIMELTIFNRSSH